MEGTRVPKAVTGHSIHDRRFHHSLTDHGRWIRERSHESYSKNYSVVFPHDEPLAGRNMRTDPLHEVPPHPPQCLLCAGCRRSRGAPGAPAGVCSRPSGGQDQAVAC